MNKFNQGSFLKALKQILQDVNSSSKSKNQSSSVKPIERWALFLSSLAILISGITLYFQFFYEKYDLRVNFISATFKNDSTLVSTLVYHNKSNTHATVLGSSMVFYQDSTDIENNSFQFSKDKNLQYYKEEFNPIVLTPGQQIHRDILNFFYFKELNHYKDLPINTKSKIKLALAIDYINESGRYSTNFIPVGWISLDSAFDINDYNVVYTTETLKSDWYYTGIHKRKK